MIDDTRDNADSSCDAEVDLASEVVELVQLRTDRNDAYKWSKDLKLLAFDSTDNTSHPGQASGCALCSTVASAGREVAETSHPTENHALWLCDRCGKGQRLEERYHCNLCNDGEYDICVSCFELGSRCKDASHQLHHVSAICEHLASNSCPQCLLTPPFPGSGNVEMFRIVRQSLLHRAEEACTHFVAVSYCWPQEMEDQSKGRYLVRDVDGTTRRNRAPEKIIDRAVAFARESGCRFIWIDQECIEQNNPEEKSLAVAAIDLVYSRAERSIALLDSVLDPETHLPALSALYEWGRFRYKTPNLIWSKEELNVWSQSEQIISLLETVSGQRWNTRAWVLQEAFSAGENMFLLFNKPSNSRVSPDSVARTDLSISEIVINMDDFALCIDWAQELFTQHPPRYAAELIPSIENFAHDNKDRIFSLFKTLEVQFIRPRLTDASSSKYRIGHPKRSCNAAAALSFLRYRENLIVSDRVFIFANICDYDYRLDMAEVERRAHPLSACFLALSILNADYSLLIPEVYDTEKTPMQLLPSRTQLREVRYFVPNSLLLIPPQIKHNFSVLRNCSLACSGFLWRIDNLLDLAWLQDCYGGAWALIRFYATYFQHVEDGRQSFGDFLRPFVAFFKVERPTSFDELKAIVVGISDSEHSDWKPPYDRRALKIETFTLYCSILLKLILFLKANSELGLADAIWNSAQAASWPIDGPFKDAEDVPGSVEDFPTELPESLHVDKLFEFEPDRHGGWLQCWIVNRIMTKGRLWHGNLIQTSSDVEWPAPTPQESELRTEEEGINNISSTLSETQLRSEPGNPDKSSSLPQTNEEKRSSNMQQLTKGEETKEIESRGRHSKQLVMSIITHRVLNTVVEEAGHKADRSTVDDPGAYVALIHDVSDGDKVNSTLKSRRAFFDVDEPCLVLTPFNTNLEALPRPETRSMSLSWVVQHPTSPVPEISESGLPILEQFKFIKAVRGMWAVGYYAGTRYAVSCVDEHEIEADKNEENYRDVMELHGK